MLYIPVICFSVKSSFLGWTSIKEQLIKGIAQEHNTVTSLSLNLA